jgi:hypothetical protein
LAAKISSRLEASLRVLTLGSHLWLAVAVVPLWLAFCNCGYAGTIATYLFTSNTSPSGVDPNVTVQLSTANLSSAYIGSDGFGNVLEAYPKSGSTTAGTALSNGSYFSVMISANSGYLLNLTSLDFDANAGDDFGVHGAFVRSSVDSYSTDLLVPTLTKATPSARSISLGSSFQNQNSLTFWFYQYTGNPSGWSNDYRNLVISGTVDATGVPEPSSATLMGLAGIMAALTLCRRRRPE